MAAGEASRYGPGRFMFAHFSHHERSDRLPWPWLWALVAALCLAVAVLAVLVPEALAPTL